MSSGFGLSGSSPITHSLDFCLEILQLSALLVSSISSSSILAFYFYSIWSLTSYRCLSSVSSLRPANLILKINVNLTSIVQFYESKFSNFLRTNAHENGKAMSPFLICLIFASQGGLALYICYPPSNCSILLKWSAPFLEKMFSMLFSVNNYKN